MTLADYQSDPKIEDVFKITIANFSSSPSYTVYTDNITLAVSDSTTLSTTSSRRLLNAGVSLSSTISVSPASAASASAVSSTLSNNLGTSSGTNAAVPSSAFANAVQQTAAAQGATTVANMQLTVSSTAPTSAPAASPFAFLVSDSYGAAVTQYYPLQGMTDVESSTMIVLTFSEDVQAGTGTINISSTSGLLRKYDIQDTNFVTFVGPTLTLVPDKFLRPGLVSVTMGPGVVTDDPHAGTPTANPSAGITSTYEFSVKSEMQSTTGVAKLQIGLGNGGSHTCSYMLVPPWYSCVGSEMCMIQVKAVGPNCNDVSQIQARKISFETQQKIAAHGYAMNGGDGQGILLSYGNGEVWPEFGVAQVH